MRTPVVLIVIGVLIHAALFAAPAVCAAEDAPNWHVSDADKAALTRFIESIEAKAAAYKKQHPPRIPDFINDVFNASCKQRFPNER